MAQTLCCLCPFQKNVASLWPTPDWVIGLARLLHVPPYHCANHICRLITSAWCIPFRSYLDLFRLIILHQSPKPDCRMVYEQRTCRVTGKCAPIRESRFSSPPTLSLPLIRCCRSNSCCRYHLQYLHTHSVVIVEMTIVNFLICTLFRVLLFLFPYSIIYLY